MTDLPAWLAASHAAANPRANTQSAAGRLSQPRPVPYRNAAPRPLPRTMRPADVRANDPQLAQSERDIARRELQRGDTLGRLADMGAAQSAPDPIHTPLQSNVIAGSRMVLPGAYDAGNAAGRIAQGEDAWGDLALNTGMAALPFLGVRGARGEPAPMPEPLPRYGANDRGLLERLNAIRTGGDDLSLPASPGFVNTEVGHPQASPDASSSGKGLGDMGNPVFYRGADSADPLDMQLPTRPGADQAVFFTNSQEEAGKFGSNIHHYHIPELDNLADVRWSDYDKDPIYTPEVMQRILADARSRGAAGVRIGGVQNFEHGPLTTTVALFNPEHAVPFESGAAQLSDGNAASGAATPFYDAFNNQTNAGLPPIPNFTPRLGANDRGALNRTRAALTGDEGLAFGQAYQYPARLDAPRNPAGVARTDRDPNRGFAANDDEFHYGTANPLPLAEVTPEPVPTGLKIEHQGSNWRIVDYGNLTSDGRPQTVRILPTGSGFRDAREAFLEIRVRRGEAPTADIHALQSPNANAPPPPDRTPKSLPRRKPPQGGFSMFGAPR